MMSNSGRKRLGGGTDDTVFGFERRIEHGQANGIGADDLDENGALGRVRLSGMDEMVHARKASRFDVL